MRRALVALLLVVLVACGPAFEGGGRVYHKEFVPAHSETIHIQCGSVPIGSGMTSPIYCPIDQYVPDEWFLHLYIHAEDGRKLTKAVQVSEATFMEYDVEEFFDCGDC